MHNICKQVDLLLLSLVYLSPLQPQRRATKSGTHNKRIITIHDYTSTAINLHAHLTFLLLSCFVSIGHEVAFPSQGTMKESLLSTEVSPRSEYEVKQAPASMFSGEEKMAEKEKLALSQTLPSADGDEVFANPSTEKASLI